MLGNVEGKRRREWQRMAMNLSKPQETVKDRATWTAEAQGFTKLDTA